MPTAPEYMVTGNARTQADAYRRGLLVSECLDARSRQARQIAGDGVGARRRKYRGFAGMAPAWADPRNARSSRSDDQLPAGRTRLFFASGTYRGVVTPCFRKLRIARSDGSATMGATKHRPVWWRSATSDRLRRLIRSARYLRSHGVASGQRPFSARDYAERCMCRFTCTAACRG